MEAEEYIKNLKKEVAKAESDKQGYQVALDPTKSAAQRLANLKKTGQVPKGKDAIKVFALAMDEKEAAALRVAAFQSLQNEIGNNEPWLDKVIALVANPIADALVRRELAKLLAALSFSSALITSKGPAVTAMLRGLVDDKVESLKIHAIQALSLQNDEFVQRRLLDSLKVGANKNAKTKPMVAPEEAIEMLGNDLHAEHYEILKNIVKNPPNPASKLAAIRLLSADNSASDLLNTVLKDGKASLEHREMAATSLEFQNPEKFAVQAKKIVGDEKEDGDLRALCLHALASNGVEDADFAKVITRLKTDHFLLGEALAKYISQSKKK